MSDREETCLGDGLYCSHDDHRMILRALREDGDHFVILGPRFSARSSIPGTPAPLGDARGSPGRRRVHDVSEAVPPDPASCNG